MKTLIFFLTLLLLIEYCYASLHLLIKHGSTFQKYKAEPVTIQFPTFDSRLNLLCRDAQTVVIENPGLTLTCFVDDVPFLFSETADYRTGGDKNVRIEVVKGLKTFSEDPETAINPDNFWWTKNKTCMMKFAATDACKLNIPAEKVYDRNIIQKKCFFVHGVGESGPNGILSSYPAYWGDMAGFTPQCSQRYFLWMDTRTRSFNDPKLQSTVCQLITNSTTSKEIKDSYIFTHSMGGLIMTASVMNGACTVNKDTSSIYMSSPPLKGSQTAVFVDRVCKGEYTVLVQTVAKYMNYCRPGNLGAWPAYIPMDPSDPAFKSIYYAGGIYSNGFICGDCNLTSNCGSGPLTETEGLKAIAILSGLDFPNDGMVTLESCTSPFIKQPLDWNPNSKFYRGEMNHADTSCRNGDNVFTNSKPCQWFSNLYLRKI